MKAILLAAGSSTRLGTLTKELPKALIDINGKSLVEKQIVALNQNGILDITIVVGPNKDKFPFNKISYFYDKDYEKHDVLGTLMSVSSLLNEDIIISYTDIVFDEEVIHSILEFKGDFGLAVEMNWKTAYEGRTDHPIEEAANVLLEKNTITKIGHNASKFGDLDQKKIGEFLGIMKFSKKGCKIFKDEYFKLLNSHKGPFHEAVSFDYAYITDMTQELIDKGYRVLPIIVKGTWCEIDTLQDLKRAKKIFK